MAYVLPVARHIRLVAGKSAATGSSRLKNKLSITSLLGKRTHKEVATLFLFWLADIRAVLKLKHKQASFT